MDSKDSSSRSGDLFLAAPPRRRAACCKLLAADLPGFFVPIVPGKMALRQRGAHEEESIQRRADGGHPARSRQHFGEMAPSDVKRLRALEAENARLKRLLTERDLDISVLKEINAKKW